jgi:threonine dehydratase
VLRTVDQISAAADRLRPVIRRTPVIASLMMSDCAGEQLWHKCENLQCTGSFKPRVSNVYMYVRRLEKRWDSGQDMTAELAVSFWATKYIAE